MREKLNFLIRFIRHFTCGGLNHYVQISITYIFFCVCQLLAESGILSSLLVRFNKASNGMNFASISASLVVFLESCQIS
jgi:hypothetical protein